MILPLPSFSRRAALRLLAGAAAALPLAPLARAQGFAGMGGEATGFAEVRPGKTFAFPEDHGPHPAFRIEWWYVTAVLEDADGAELGAQWTLFRIGLAPPGERGTERGGEGWQTAQLWMAHAAVTTAATHAHAETYARAGIGAAGAAAAPFAAWIGDWELAATAPPASDPATGALGPLRMTAGGARFAYDLALATEKPVALQGEDGYSVKSEAGQASYYYCQPFFAAEGMVSLDGRARRVTGRAWMDREWSSRPLTPEQTGWDWFALHLADGARLMVYRLRRADGRHYVTGNRVAPDASSERIAPGSITAEPTGWAEVAGREVPVRWRIADPALGLDIRTEPLNEAAWMGTTFAYWEGPIRFSGSHDGRGYLEMTGY